jgi:hypothetical protein
MVKATEYAKFKEKEFKKGDSLPSDAVEFFGLHSPHIRDDYIEINGKWMPIEDPKIKGFVEMCKKNKSNSRINDFFGLKKDELKAKPDNSHMLKTHPDKKPENKEEDKPKAKSVK